MTHCRPLSIVGSVRADTHASALGDDLVWEEGYAAGASFLNSDDSALFGDIGGVMMLMDRG